MNEHEKESFQRQIQQAQHAHLYPCQVEVLYWAAFGKTTSETAAILELSEHTVSTYRKEAIRKLDASNITNAVWLATQIGLIA